MKVLFLNPPFLPRFSRPQRSPAVTKSGTLYYPIWLAYAAGLLEQEGYEVKLLDSPAENLSCSATLKIAAEFLPKLIVVDTSTPSIYNDIEVAEKLKTILPDSFVLLVGTHVSALPEETLSLCKNIDGLARGEYDQTVLNLAEALSKNSLDIKEVPGLSYKALGKINHNPDRPLLLELDRLPFVSKAYKKHLRLKNYFFAASVYPQVQILTARGCPFHCFFCLWPQTLESRIYRSRSPENVLSEFLFIKHSLPEIKGVVIEDDTFTVDKQRVIAICELLIKHKVALKWNANVRFDIDIETMKIMKAAGCYLLITGIESFRQDILNNITKSLDESYIQRFFDSAKRAGLLVHAAFMAGNPGETKETLKNSLELAIKAMPDTAQFFPLMPYPGTEAYKWAKDNGYLKIATFRDYLNKDGLHNCVLDLPGLTRTELLDSCDKSRTAFYLNPRYLIYKLMRISCNPGEFIRTYMAFRKFKKYLFYDRKLDV